VGRRHRFLPLAVRGPTRLNPAESALLKGLIDRYLTSPSGHLERR
jgi:hypothetical protein